MFYVYRFYSCCEGHVRLPLVHDMSRSTYACFVNCSNGPFFVAISFSLWLVELRTCRQGSTFLSALSSPAFVRLQRTKGTGFRVLYGTNCVIALLAASERE
jgi:hypothetical protein